ncbi:MAG: hypothetical protein EHM59_20075 [Betaproteobacteria bacterium]|nr:MAG: hypothetical protein EHM59_20075 [Betaproteobacteria bacterium]
MNKRIVGVGAVCSAATLAMAVTYAQAAPIQETQGSAVVLHGGVGHEDRAAMEQKAKEHNLRLTFVRKGSGAYLSDVRVVIRDRKGAVLVDTVASGPWLFANLPAGDYTVAATAQGGTLTQAIAIQGAARRDWVFRFDLPAGESAELNPK